MLRLNIYSIPISGTFKSATLAGLFVRAHCTKVFKSSRNEKKNSIIFKSIPLLVTFLNVRSCTVHVQAQYVSATMPVAIS